MLGGFGVQLNKKNQSSQSRVESWVKKRLQNQDLNVIAREVQCNEPDCVPIETMLAIVSDNLRWVGKVLKPIAEVTEDDILNLDGPFEKGTITSSSMPYSDDSMDVTVAVDDTKNVDSGTLFNGNDMKVGDGKKEMEREGWLEQVLDQVRKELTPLNRREQTKIMAKFEQLFSEIRRNTSLLSRSSKTPTIPVSSYSSVSVSESSSNDFGSSKAAPFNPPSSSVLPTPTPDMRMELQVAQTTVVPMKLNKTSSALVSTSVSIPASEPTSHVLNETIMVPMKKAVPVTSSSTSAPVRPRGMLADLRMRAMETDDGPRHVKGTRPQGCPCCDPDNIDNIVQAMLMENGGI